MVIIESLLSGCKSIVQWGKKQKYEQLHRLFCLVWIFLPCDNVPEAELYDCGSVPSAEELLSLFCYSSRESAIIIYIQISTYILAFWSNIAFGFAFVNIQLLVSENYADPEPQLETMTVQRVCEFLDNGSAYWYTNYGCVFNFDFKKTHLILWINSAKKNFQKFVLKIDKTTILINSIVLHHIIVQ